MNTYSAYKDSGEQWLGQIPAHWELKPGLAVFRENKEKNSLGQENTVLSLSYGKIIVKENKNEGLVPAEYTSYQIVHPDYIIIRCTDLQNDKVSLRTGLVKDDGIITSAYLGLIVKADNPAYIHYFLHALDITKELYRYGSGLRQSLSWVDFKRLNVILPPIEEQEKIVAYLDEQTGKLDQAIAREQKMIDLLEERKQIIIQQAVTKGLNPNAKMKDSGIDWIGEIPEGWKVMRLKRLVDFAGRIGFRGYGTEDLTDEENGAITLSPSNMQNGKMTYTKCAYLKWHKYYESPEIMVYDGDILFVKTGSTYGKTAIVKDLPKEATINPQLLILTNIKGDNRFIAHMLSTPLIKNQVERIVIGGTIPTISQEKIGNLRLIVPNKDEQISIVEYIAEKTKPIDDAIKAKDKLIYLLQERKQIIINEVVTGKIKVS